MNTEKTQLSLLDPPIVRRSDPKTSHLAAARHTLGKRAVRQRQILDLVNRFPKRTSGEYARIFVQEQPKLPIAVAADTPNKRLSDLNKKGLIEHVGTRECSDSGYECRIWQITAAGVRELS